MDKCTTEYCYIKDEWQNSVIMMGYHIKRKLEAVENGSVTIQQSPPKPLTNEALYMIFVILAFVVLAVVGTLLTIYDYFCKECKEKTNSNGILKQKDAAQNGYHVEDQQISFDTPSDSGWLNTSKSFFNCFCVITNGKKIFQTSSTEDPLYCLHGIRLFCTVCIIISHCIGFYVYISNGVSSKGFFSNWYSQYLLAVHNAITAFFVLGGFLNAFSFFHYYEKMKGNIPYLLFYLNRFRRITPVHLLVIGVFTTLFSYTGSGPIWPRYTTHPMCKDNWWRDLFYITNFWSVSEQCLPWTWYLVVDMQLYIISPLFLVPLIKKPKLGYALIALAIFGGSLTSFILSLQYGLEDPTSKIRLQIHELTAVYKETWDYFDIVYAQSYARLCSYLIGFLLAQYVYKRRTNKTENDSTVILTCGWIITLVMLNIVIFALYDKEVSAWDSAFYIAVKDIFYSCGFAWIVYVCVTGQAGFLNRIFSWKYLVPFSRLCFCAYLIHLALLIRYYYQAEKPETPSLSPLIHQIVHILTLTFALSFLTSLLFETPVSRLFALYMESKIKSLKKD